MSLTETKRALLQAAEICGRDRSDGYCKCDRVLRVALKSIGSLNSTVEEALCCSGYEHEAVARLYDELRALVQRGFLDGRGDLSLPAGPRYTECGISLAGRELLEFAARRAT